MKSTQQWLVAFSTSAAIRSDKVGASSSELSYGTTLVYQTFEPLVRRSRFLFSADAAHRAQASPVANFESLRDGVAGVRISADPFLTRAIAPLGRIAGRFAARIRSHRGFCAGPEP